MPRPRAEELTVEELLWALFPTTVERDEWERGRG